MEVQIQGGQKKRIQNKVMNCRDKARGQLGQKTYLEYKTSGPQMSLELGDKTTEKPTLFWGNRSVTPKPYTKASCCPSIKNKYIFKHKIIYMPIN